MATIDKTVKFKAGGKEYAVCYPLKAAMGAEQELPGNSLFKAVAVASLTNFYIMLKWGLIGGGMPENTPAETFDEIWAAALAEMSAQDLYMNVIVPAFLKSGTFGKVPKNLPLGTKK